MQHQLTDARGGPRREGAASPVGVDAQAVEVVLLAVADAPVRFPDAGWLADATFQHGLNIGLRRASQAGRHGIAQCCHAGIAVLISGPGIEDHRRLVQRDGDGVRLAKPEGSFPAGQFVVGNIVLFGVGNAGGVSGELRGW